MQDAFGIVLFVVVGLGAVIAIASLFGRGRLYDDIGRGGTSIGEERPASAAERDEEIRQLLAARNARRAARGEPAVDVERELRALTHGPSPGRLTQMADVRRFDLEELANRPGTYYNPATEVVLVVDDSTALETNLIEEDGDAEWVLLGDEPAVDEHKRDELVERFETRCVGTGPDTDDDVVEDEDVLEPDPDEEF